MQHHNTVKVHDSVETVGNGDDGAITKLFADDGLDDGIGVNVDAERRKK